MKRKMSVLGLAILSLMLCTTLVNAQPEVETWTDKLEYLPGEKGTLYIAFYNNRDSAVTIKNITVTYYNWRAYIDGTWIGNKTYTVNVPLSGRQTTLLNDAVDGGITFTVPTDGRAISTTVEVKIGIEEIGFKYDYPTISVQQTPPKYMEQIATLFTIQVVLMIVCTIIIAATIFLARRPQVMWRKEEKVE